MIVEPIYPFLESYLPTLKRAAVVELGANNGADTEWILNRLLPPFRYYAWEPDPRNFQLLRDRVGAEPYVTLYPSAIGRADYQGNFYLSGGRPDSLHTEHWDSSSLQRPAGIRKRYPWMTFRTIQVDVMRLDTWFEELVIPKIDLIWADVQGAELAMLEGGRAALRRTRFLYTECYARPNLYANQPCLDDIMEALPGQWNIRIRTATDALLENASFREG